jgi:hypothetical protein
VVYINFVRIFEDQRDKFNLVLLGVLCPVFSVFKRNLRRNNTQVLPMVDSIKHVLQNTENDTKMAIGKSSLVVIV